MDEHTSSSIPSWNDIKHQRLFFYIYLYKDMILMENNGDVKKVNTNRAAAVQHITGKNKL